MQFEDPMTFECECGHTGQYSVSSLLGLNAQCTACGFSLRSLGRSMQQTIDTAHACGKIAVIAVELELEWFIEFDDPELEQLVTVGDFARLLSAKRPEWSFDQARKVVVAKLRSHGVDDSVAIEADTPLRGLFSSR